jgi:hypothetical protein
VRYYIGFVVTNIGGWFVNFYPQIGYFSAFQPTNELFGLATEHGTAYHFNPAFLGISYVGFYKHGAGKAFTLFLRSTKIDET